MPVWDVERPCFPAARRCRPPNPPLKSPDQFLQGLKTTHLEGPKIIGRLREVLLGWLIKARIARRWIEGDAGEAGLLPLHAPGDERQPLCGRGGGGALAF